MKRPRKFLIFILILLIINTIFFIAWYGFDMQGRIKGIVEKSAGKALKGELHINSFNISDQQLFAQGISFSAADSSLAFKVDSARVRFNLLRFIFSGFKIHHMLNQVEITRADASYSLRPKPKTYKPPKKFELPDLGRYFNELKVTDSRFRFELKLPLKIAQPGLLSVRDQLSGINLSVVNARSSQINLKAASANKGTVSASAILSGGRLLSSHLEIGNYIPQYASHPQIRDFSTELNLVADASQAKKGAPVDFTAKAIVWDTRALLFEAYPLRVPYLTVESDGGKLTAEIARSSLGTSSFGGSVALSGLPNDIRIDPSQMSAQLDLGMLDLGFEGLIDASLTASGSLSDPSATLFASSPQVSFQGQTVSNLALDSAYAKKELKFALPDAVWENQSVSLEGTFGVEDRKAKARVVTSPLSLEQDLLKIDAAADVELTFYTALPEIIAGFDHIDVERGKLQLPTMDGALKLYPVTYEEPKKYYVDLELNSADSTKISLVGDLMDRNLLLDLQFQSLALNEIVPLKFLSSFQPRISGKVSSFLTGDKAVVSSRIDLDTSGIIEYDTGLKLIGSYDIASRNGNVILNGEDGSLNGQPVSFELIGGIQGSDLTLHSFKLNDQMGLKGNFDLNDSDDLAFEFFVRDLSSGLVKSYLPFLELPDLSGVSLTASYKPGAENSLDATLTMQDFQVPGIRPLAGELRIQGPPGQLEISGGIDNQSRRLVDLTGSLDLSGETNLRLNAQAYGLTANDVLYSAMAEGRADANFTFAVTDIFSPERDMSFLASVSSSAISIPEVADLDNILVKIAQTSNILIVDTLAVSSPQYGSVRGSGALDYNLLTGRFYEGSHTLNLSAQGLLFDWLERNVDYVKSASGTASLTCSLKAFDDQLMVQSGILDIQRGRIHLQDQTEPIRDISVQAVVVENRLTLNNFTALSGDGKLTVFNEFDPDPTTHLKVGFLDLGSLSLKIDQPGALVNIPLVTAPRNLSKIVLQGQNTPYATIKGPFEDMRISAEVLVYNSAALFPPDTDNLLNLIYSVRSSLTKPTSASDPVPLPFTLDLMIKLADNIRYVTYPANLRIQPGGFLHIVYDGQAWSASEANFVSEQGSIDFFGTVFQAENLTVSILESQNLLDIRGSFIKRAADGTVITLSVNTDSDTSKSIFDRLTFNLTSDNPNDLTVSNILSRLRFSSSSEELSPTQRSSLFQDEALNLISDNLNTSLISPFLYPVENTIRRWLKLDDFSINAGFIQNLFTEYTNDPNQLAEYVNMDQFMSDITQFSSSILLNNLSFAMSKYLGRRFFLDYTLTLQEATDLQNKTQIMVSHDTSLRVLLPLQLRLTYTFKYEPRDAGMSHELMLQRSFRFWGL